MSDPTHNDIMKALGHLTGEMSGVKREIGQLREDLVLSDTRTIVRVYENEKRIGKLEQWRNWLAGGFATISALGAAGVLKIKDMI